MSNLINEIKNYQNATNEQKNVVAKQIYFLADSYINNYKYYNNNGEQIVDSIGEEDLRQDLVTEAYNCLANGKYNSKMGTKEEFINLAFDMVISAHHFERTQPNANAVVYYKNPLNNFKTSYSSFKNVAQVGYVPLISPFTYAKVLGVKPETLCKTYGFKEEDIKKFIKQDDATLSLYKVKAPNKK